MPNIYVMGLDHDEVRAFSRHATDFFERELGTPREHVYVYRQEVTLFRDGAASEMPTILRVSWVRRPPDHFPRAARGLTRIVHEELGRRNPVQVELHEKWDDAMVDGEPCSDWAAKSRR